jgi:hypothetical protein
MRVTWQVDEQTKPLIVDHLSNLIGPVGLDSPTLMSCSASYANAFPSLIWPDQYKDVAGDEATCQSSTQLIGESYGEQSDADDLHWQDAFC